jgi:hypothetical protein
MRLVRRLFPRIHFLFHCHHLKRSLLRQKENLLTLAQAKLFGSNSSKPEAQEGCSRTEIIPLTSSEKETQNIIIWLCLLKN